MSSPRSLYLLFIVLWPVLLYASPMKAPAQNNEITSSNTDVPVYTLVFRGEPLSEVLRTFVQKTGLNLVYDTAILDDTPVYVTIRELPAEQALARILADTSLDYITLSSGTLVLVRSARQQPSFGSVAGRIVDHRTGRPLPGATILLASADGGTASNTSGFFSIPGVLSGPQELIVSYVGYEPLRKTVTIPVDGVLRTQLALREKPYIAEPIVINDHSRRLGQSGGAAQWVTVSGDGPLQPGNDPVRSLGLFPGVQFQLPLATLNIQGSGADEHRFYLDGMPVYHPYSFGYLFSAFSPYAIDRVTIHKAGFDARAGSQISGLISMTHDVSNRASNTATLQADAVSSNLRADVAGRLGDMDLETLLAIRTNIWDIYQSPVLSATMRNWDYIDPVIANLLMDGQDSYRMYDEALHDSRVGFRDIHLSSRLRIDPFQSVSYSLYSGYNTLGTELLNRLPQPDAQYPEFMFARDSYTWNNRVTRLRYDALLTARTDIMIQAGHSGNRLEHSYRMAGSIDAGLPSGVSAPEAMEAFTANPASGMHQWDDNRIDHGIFQAEIDYAASPRLRISNGFQVDYIRTRVNLSDLFYIPTLSAASAGMGSVFTGIDWHPVAAWRLNVSSRLTYISNTDKVYAEPRFSAQYDRDASAIGYWSMRLAGGIYRQFIHQFSVTNPGPSSLVPSLPVWTHAGELAVPRAYHLTLSFLNEPTEYTRIRLETFTKWQPVTHQISYPKLLRSGQDHISRLADFTHQTRSFQGGAGITLTQQIPRIGTEMMAGYDWTVSRMDMQEQFGRWLPAPWSEPHRVRVMLQTRVNNRIQVYGQWSGMYGRVWGYRQAYYDFMVMHNRSLYGTYRLDRPEDDRLSAFSQLDAGVHYQQRVGGGVIRLKLDLINVLNRDNMLDYGLVPASSAGTDGSSGESERSFVKHARTLPGFNPAVSVQLSW